MMDRIKKGFGPYSQWPDERHLDVLDGVRALCILTVGWFHIWQQSWLIPHVPFFGETISLDFIPRSGYLFVDGLLLLSGFLLYLPYAREDKALPRIIPFYKRRLIRILPSYLLCLIPLFILSCAQGKYASAGDAAKDLIAHLTFTHTLFYSTYFLSPINGALWTLGVEMQFYLLFPFLARAFRKQPLLTYLGMAGVALGFRFYASHAIQDPSMYFNQLPAFLDVYANGFLAAAAFAGLKKKMGEKSDAMVKVFFTAIGILCLILLVQIQQDQAFSSRATIQQKQMDNRFFLSAVLSCFMICAAFSVPPVRFLLGNRLMRFLSAVSFQFYIYHQMLAVKIKEWRLIPSATDTPWLTGDYAWQIKYTACCFGLALLLAALITYLFERPIARALRKAAKAEQS